jgi:hypothetical protein
MWLPRRTLVSKTEHAAGSWKKLHNKEKSCFVLLTKYRGDQIKEGETDRVYEIHKAENKFVVGFGGRHEGQTPLCIPRH